MLLASGCLDPTCIGEVRPRENHVPVVEVTPEPTFEPVPAPVGLCCRPTSLAIQTMSDADEDFLTVRYDILIRRQLASEPQRINLFESQPITQTDGKYPTGTTDLRLNPDLIFGQLGLLPEIDTQLIELRVSDNGFVNDEKNVPIVPDGGGLFFASWLIRLSDVSCAEACDGEGEGEAGQ